MANKMLVDASHPEETRVVVVRGNRIEEFDFESEHKKQIKGNIYLAKVTRVEPSLQAAFVDYGGNRHGFLAFSEIHPDYYQIPVADRQALVEDELARAREEDENEERKIARARRKPTARPAGRDDGDNVSESVEDAGADDARHGEDDFADGEELSENEHEAPELMGDENDGDGEPSGETDAEESGETASEDGEIASEDGESPSGRRRGRRSRSRRGNAEEAPGSDEEAEEVDELGAEDAMEEVPVRQPRAPRKQYKIQEVIKRRQILLVQVVKEERGNKGAALTTYLSLAGRYSVLMPNTARGGGISRKITNVADRKRLKEVARDLDVPRGMGIILRTAGAMRTKAEVKRDYEYLMRLWETVRGLTLSSTAPTLVYEEGSLIKRSIRDLYNKDIDQILVSGEDGYREAKDFMRMLMPSQSKVVQPYRDLTPIFARGGIEAQLDKMLQPHVTLKSGGYIIINQTEALVAIDVNSGRSTREHSIEDTAFQTNMEAAEEVARQLRLRDLAGLIVIDFIDMEEKRNNRAVEKKIKDCLKDDRARIQVGRISHFGLMEMSRQRIRASVLESTTQTCPVCNGVGHIRSSSSLALNVVRTIEEHLQKDGTHDLIVKVPTATALYVLNEKRGTIHELENQFGLHIAIQADDTHGHQSVIIEHGAEAARPMPPREVINPLTVIADELDDEIDAAAAALDGEPEASVEDVPVAGQPVEGSDEERRRKRRRRRRRNGSDEQQASDGAESEDGEADEAEATEAGDDAETPAESEGVTDGEDISADEEAARARKRRRRGRRGGRKNRETSGEGLEGEDGEAHEIDDDAVSFEGETIDIVTEAEIEASASHGFEPEADVQAVEEYRPAANDDAQPEADAVDAPAVSHHEEAAAFDPAPEVHHADEPPAIEEAFVPEPQEEVAPEPVEPAPPAPARVTSSAASEDDDKPKRTGWWARRSFF